MIRLRGYLVRVWRRSRGIPREIAFLLEMTNMELRSRSDHSLVDEFKFMVEESWWALTHFPSEDVAQSWLNSREGLSKIKLVEKSK